MPSVRHRLLGAEFVAKISGIFFLFAFSVLAAAQGSSPNTDLDAREQQIIAAARTEAAPAFHGPRIIGVRPNTPLIFSLAVSGERPVAFGVKKLPPGLKLDSATGIITGTVARPGEFTFTALANNSAGQAHTQITLVCGDQLALTPPMGWNSYDTFGDSVTEQEMRTNIDWFKHHLQPLGWEYVVVDYRWYDPGAYDNNANGRAGVQLTPDDFGRLLPSPNRFPSATNGAGFRPLADYAHSLGLKFGIHVMRGIPHQSVFANTPIAGSSFHAMDAAETSSQCAWCQDMFGVDASKPAGQAWYDSLLRLYASWGVDFIKVDDLSRPYSAAEVKAIHDAIEKSGRSIVFSTSPGETPVARAAHIAVNANQWRISDDFWDAWKFMEHNFDLLKAWQGVAGPGHWPDADMIPLGKIGLRSVGKYRWTAFTRSEQLTLMSLWAVVSSPLMLGMNLPANDDWTTALISNPEVLAVNQDPLGQAAVRHPAENQIEVWSKDLADGSKALTLINRGRAAEFDESRAIFKSALITRSAPGPTNIDLDVTGAKKLWLVVDDGGDGFDCDHADWLEPEIFTADGAINLTSRKWNSATAGWQQALVNRSVSGGPLTVGGITSTNGIGTHSPSIIEYALPAGGTRFTVRAGLDLGGTSQNRGASVHFLVFTSDPHPASQSETVTISFSTLGLTGTHSVRDLWLRKDLPAADHFTAEIPPHGCVLLKIK